MATADIPDAYLAQAREICLALHEATEIETWDHPTIRVRSKIFAGIGAGEASVEFRPDGSPDLVCTMSMKATHDDQAALLALGAPYFRPRYVGSKGWIGIMIDDETDWAEVEELVIDSYLLIAPKTLARQVVPPPPT